MSIQVRVYVFSLCVSAYSQNDSSYSSYTHSFSVAMGEANSLHNLAKSMRNKQNVPKVAGDHVKFPVNAPPAYNAGLPELTDEDIAGFLEMAQTMTSTTAEPYFSHEAQHEPPQSLESSSYEAILRAEREHRHSSPSLLQVPDGAAEAAAAENDLPDSDTPDWKYTDMKSPPAWLQYSHTQGGLPTTRPPVVPQMLPPPPPLAFPAFSYTSRHTGPYAPQPVPSYSIGSPPPVPAANWVPLAAYIQPPRDAPNPENSPMTPV
jgi:hypothetical protein